MEMNDTSRVTTDIVLSKQSTLGELSGFVKVIKPIIKKIFLEQIIDKYVIDRDLVDTNYGDFHITAPNGTRFYLNNDKLINFIFDTKIEDAIFTDERDYFVNFRDFDIDDLEFKDDFIVEVVSKIKDDLNLEFNYFSVDNEFRKRWSVNSDISPRELIHQLEEDEQFLKMLII